jgi:hypothetical protein
MPDRPYDARDHYWIVAGDETRLWSSASAGYVPAGDTGYLAWSGAGGWPTRIVSEEELDAVLVAAGCGDRAPHPPKRQVLKSVIIARLIEAGKITAAKAGLEQDAAAYARWWAPDRPAINHDDPDALTLLAAIGADAEAIMAP